jgi:hypothetical protein
MKPFFDTEFTRNLFLEFDNFFVGRLHVPDFETVLLFSFVLDDGVHGFVEIQFFDTFETLFDVFIDLLWVF